MGLKHILSGDLHSHPAVEAWLTAAPAAVVPDSVHVFRERPTQALYLLPGVAPGGVSVFAKRTPAARMAIERAVYEEILPRLLLTAPRCYGCWSNGPDGWLFVEHVGVERYSRTEPAHLAVAAHWLGTLHATAPQLPAARSLPDGGPARYLTHLRGGRDRILFSLDTFSYAPEEVTGLTSILARCAAIEARWDVVETACERVPATVVHGDFQPKNVYLRTDGGILHLFPIDWEMVGWGSPAADLAALGIPRVDLTTYWTVVREFWPDLAFSVVERLAASGRLLSGCAAFDWKCATLLTENPRARSSAVLKLGIIHDLLADAAEAVGMQELARR